MKNLKLFLLGLMLCAALPSQAWDRTRHDAIAYIAECNLTPRAKRNIARYLDHSIVYYASWMDKYRDTPEFRNVEHVSYVDADMQLVDTLRKGKTNCVVELMHAIDRLKDYRNMSDSLVPVEPNVCHSHRGRPALPFACQVPRLQERPCGPQREKDVLPCDVGLGRAGRRPRLELQRVPAAAGHLLQTREGRMAKGTPANGCTKRPSPAG